MGRRPHLPGLCGWAGYTNKSPYERGRRVRIKEGSVVTEAEVRGTERDEDAGGFEDGGGSL